MLQEREWGVPGFKPMRHKDTLVYTQVKFEGFNFVGLVLGLIHGRCISFLLLLQQMTLNSVA